jgi:hypothetical protein
LEDEIEKLEKQISKLKNSDEYYTKFEQYAREILNSVMNDHRWIVPLAIDAVIESLRKDSFKQLIINDEICDQANRDKLFDSCELLFDKLLKRLMEGTLQNPKEDINAINLT